MAKPSTDPQISSSSSSSSIISSASNNVDIDPSRISNMYVYSFLKRLGAFTTLPEGSEKKGFVSNMMHDLLKVDRIERGRIICLLTVKPRVTNAYGTFHGGAVAGVAELVAMACARTVVDEDKDLFLGELAMSYLSAAGPNVVLEVDGCIVRSGRNVTTVSVEFRMKETRKVVYTARATFFTMPSANL